jgi:hypothetical protein
MRISEPVSVLDREKSPMRQSANEVRSSGQIMKNNAVSSGVIPPFDGEAREAVRRTQLSN